MEGDEVRVALLNGPGAERLPEGDCVDCIGFGGCGYGGGGDGDFEGGCHGCVGFGEMSGTMEGQ